MDGGVDRKEIRGGTGEVEGEKTVVDKWNKLKEEKQKNTDQKSPSTLQLFSIVDY